MKKMTIVLALLLLASGLFARDASVLPSETGRFSVAPGYSFATGEYDDLRIFERYNAASMRLFNLGLALDYGAFNWLTASIQWEPGLTLSSDSNANVNNVSELFVSAKMQLLGEQALLRSGEFRFAIAPGVFIPLMNNHIFAIGARFYFDWIFNRNFFVNLYNETLFFPGNQDFRNAGPEFYGVSADVNYSLRFGIGSAFTTPIANGVDLTVGFPATYRHLPVPQHSIFVNPNISLFFADMLPLPMEFKLQYDIPLWGMNSLARHNVSLLVRMYFALPGR